MDTCLPSICPLKQYLDSFWRTTSKPETIDQPSVSELDPNTLSHFSGHSDGFRDYHVIRFIARGALYGRLLGKKVFYSKKRHFLFISFSVY